MNKCLNCGKVIMSDNSEVGWCSMECYEEMHTEALQALSGDEKE